MANWRKRFAGQENQLSLFDILTKKNEAPASLPHEGSLNIHEKVRLSICTALKQSTKSRWQIAGDISHLIGEEITIHQLNSFAAESKAYHFPCHLAPAFCRATDNYELLKVLADAAGMFILPGTEALRSEIQKCDEQVRKAQTEKKRRLALLAAMESKQ